MVPRHRLMMTQSLGNPFSCFCEALASVLGPPPARQSLCHWPPHPIPKWLKTKQKNFTDVFKLDESENILKIMGWTQVKQFLEEKPKLVL
jgi:hypothetical protein